jgi:DNA-3-methyladenine glycosylase I
MRGSLAASRALSDLRSRSRRRPLVEKSKPTRPVVAVAHDDGLYRCPWPGQDPFYVAYHDEEWGVPEWDDRALFEKLILDGFQAGLSWITILRKREAFRAAFDGFDPEKIVRYKPAKIEKLMNDPGIVRNRAKILAASTLARIYLDLAERDGFAHHLWSFVDGKPIQNKRKSIREVPAQSKEAEAISKDLKARGGNFVGPTIVYAFMQATGMVNDHLVDCHRHSACAKLAHKR